MYLTIEFLSSFLLYGPGKFYDTIIVKPDAIGDFIMFVPFLNELVNSFPNEKILVVGNESYKDFALSFGLSGNLEFCWINRRQFSRNIIYRFKLLRDLRKLRGGKLLCPVYSEDENGADVIMRVIDAQKKYTLRPGDKSKRCVKRHHTEIVSQNLDLDPNYQFEIDRHKRFFSQFIKQNLDDEMDFFDKIRNQHVDQRVPNKYFVVFIGASDEKRRWSEVKYMELCERLSSIYSGEIVICGSLEDLERMNKLNIKLPRKGLNLVGKTSLGQLMAIIGNCDFLISNESCAPHLAYLTSKKKCFVISNGNHFGRFCPYPRRLYENYNGIFHPDVNLDGLHNLDQIDRFDSGSDLNINDIPVKTVYNIIKEGINFVN